MTRKEQIKEVAGAYAIDEVKDTCNPASKRGLLYAGFVDGAEWADAHPHWISVEDEMPPMRDEDGMSDTVLTCTKRGRIYMNRYDYRGKTWGNPLAFNVTHWMPLPSVENLKKGGEE